jgi:integrase
LAYEATDSGLLSPDLAAGIRRVKGSKKLGFRLGNWLTADEARQLWQLPDPFTLKAKRDRAILAVLLGCGLRRRELTELSLKHEDDGVGVAGLEGIERSGRLVGTRTPDLHRVKVAL